MCAKKYLHTVVIRQILHDLLFPPDFLLGLSQLFLKSPDTNVPPSMWKYLFRILFVNPLQISQSHGCPLLVRKKNFGEQLGKE